MQLCTVLTKHKINYYFAKFRVMVSVLLNALNERKVTRHFSTCPHYCVVETNLHFWKISCIRKSAFTREFLSGYPTHIHFRHVQPCVNITSYFYFHDFSFFRPPPSKRCTHQKGLRRTKKILTVSAALWKYTQWPFCPWKGVSPGFIFVQHLAGF